MKNVQYSQFLCSIRANQHTETIQAQYAVLQQQKEELSSRLSEAEDRESKNKAALINLQCVLEQFQKGKIIVDIKSHFFFNLSMLTIL